MQNFCPMRYNLDGAHSCSEPDRFLGYHLQEAGRLCSFALLIMFQFSALESNQKRLLVIFQRVILRQLSLEFSPKPYFPQTYDSSRTGYQHFQRQLSAVTGHFPIIGPVKGFILKNELATVPSSPKTNWSLDPVLQKRTGH